MPKKNALTAEDEIKLSADELARSTLERWGHRPRRERGVAVYA